MLAAGAELAAPRHAQVARGGACETRHRSISLPTRKPTSAAGRRLRSRVRAAAGVVRDRVGARLRSCNDAHAAAPRLKKSKRYRNMSHVLKCMMHRTVMIQLNVASEQVFAMKWKPSRLALDAHNAQPTSALPRSKLWPAPALRLHKYFT